ncbi:hypothetical protein C8Q76DRAFT_798292 [Earliella scabrosa]|nr:hypothetical protein C8Q76DRAFT_798292 [Earliella scabrosa]
MAHLSGHAEDGHHDVPLDLAMIEPPAPELPLSDWGSDDEDPLPEDPALAAIFRRLANLTGRWRARPVDPQTIEAAKAANASIPINRAPNDVLVLIFLALAEMSAYGWRLPARPDTCDDWKHAYGSSNWKRIMGVCTHWRNVVCQTPLLWRDITVRKSVEWLDLSFQRSANALVSLTVTTTGVLVRAMPLILHHSPRIQHLLIKNIAGEDVEPIEMLFSDVVSRFPRLEELCMHSDGRSFLSAISRRPHLSLQLDEEQLKSLRILRLSGLSLPLKSYGRLPNLRVLDLSHTHSTPPMKISSLQTFLSALAACPSLQELRLNLATPDHVWEYMSIDGRDASSITVTVSLPHLRHLCIFCFADFAVSDSLSPMPRRLLDHLRLPADAEIIIAIDVDTDESDRIQYTDIVPHGNVAHGHTPILRHASSAVFANDYFRCSTPEGGRLEVVLIRNGPAKHWMYSQEKQFADLCTILSSAPLTDLSIEVKHITVHALSSLFRNFDAVTSLSLTVVGSNSSSEAIDSLLSTLSPHGLTGDRTSETQSPCHESVPLPRLQTLHITGPLGSSMSGTLREGRIKRIEQARAEAGARLAAVTVEEKTVRTAGDGDLRAMHNTSADDLFYRSAQNGNGWSDDSD